MSSINRGMEYTNNQKKTLSQYTSDYNTIKIIDILEYKSDLLKDYHVIWLWDDPYRIHLIPRLV